MKWTFLLVAMMLFALTGCGGDKKDSANTGYFTNGLSTVEGFYNLQTGALTVNGQNVTPADQQSMMVVNQALQIARNSVQPTMVSNMYGYRARITGQLVNSNYNTSNPYGSMYGNGYYGSTYGQVVSISNIQFY